MAYWSRSMAAALSGAAGSASGGRSGPHRCGEHCGVTSTAGTLYLCDVAVGVFDPGAVTVGLFFESARG